MPDGTPAKKPFTRTQRQVKATALLIGFMYVMLFGGARSGKTFIILRRIIIRAVKVKSRHLVCRQVFQDVKKSVIYDTFPKMMALCFPNLPYKLNRSDWFVTLPNGSEIWFGGLDDPEKVLGNEYSTIFANECSQIAHDAITTLLTRLAENVGLKPKMFLDCNPPPKKHWSYLMFIRGIQPDDKKPIEDFETEYASMLMNPSDNLENLPSHYIKLLNSLPKRKRERFLLGLFLDDIEGALWDDDMINRSQVQPVGEIIRTVISVDPSVTHNPNSDACGIVVCALDDNGNGRVLADHTGVMSTKAWAKTAVNLYDQYDANCIVVETNQGGDLCVDALKAQDPKAKVVKVHAAKGKFARAEPITVFYEVREDDSADKRIISHAEGLHELEEEMTDWVPDQTKESPNRIDALVWGMTYLLLKKTAQHRVFIPGIELDEVEA